MALLKMSDIKNLNKPVEDINLEKIMKRVFYVPELDNKLSKEELVKILFEAGYKDLKSINVDDKSIYQTILPMCYKYLDIDLYANRERLR